MSCKYICPCCFKNWKERNDVQPSMMLEDGTLLYKCVVCQSIMPNPLKENSMGTKQSSVEEKLVVCQFCKFHSNKPLTCSVYEKYVGRKQDATECKKFKRIK